MTFLEWLKSNKDKCNLASIYYDDNDNLVASCFVKQATNCYGTRTITIGDINRELNDDDYKELNRTTFVGINISEDDSEQVKQSKRGKLLGL